MNLRPDRDPSWKAIPHTMLEFVQTKVRSRAEAVKVKVRFEKRLRRAGVYPEPALPGDRAKRGQKLTPSLFLYEDLEELWKVYGG